MSELDEIQVIFFEECVEGLAAADAGLAAMARGDTSADTVNRVFRAVHSIKGGSGAFGHQALLGFSHRFENVMDEVRAGRIAADAGVVKLLLSAFDILSDHVAAAQGLSELPDDATVTAALEEVLNGNKPSAAAPAATTEVVGEAGDEFGFMPVAVSLDALDDPFGFEPVVALLDDLDPPASEPAPGDGWTVHFRPSRAALANGAEPLLVLRELERLGATIVAVDTGDLPTLREMDAADGYCRWTLIIPVAIPEAEIRDCFDFVAPDSEIVIEARQHVARPPAAKSAAVSDQDSGPPPAPPPKAGRSVATETAPISIRVELARLDSLLNLVGELVIRNSILADRLSPSDQDKVELPQLSRLTRQIQDSVMGLRAQPIKQAFGRVPRMLRDLAAETGKQVRLETVGDATEVDKTVIERIGDPLTHMIRNAVDHGIEDPTVRAARGKPAEGVIHLSAEQKGGRILIRVADDGAGIDRERVRAKAIEKGIVAADAILTNEEIDQLICAAGFSTADTISNISGRGVGMDVVRSNIETLGGRLEITSVPGEGTGFTMILPLTLAILDGMIVRLHGQRYVLPLASVIESVQPEPGQVQRTTPTSEVIELRGAYLPIRRLTDVFDMLQDKPRAPEDSLVIVVESETAGRVGLMVDTIDDRREVVVKSLDQNLHPIRGLGGATVLGDGSIALILDIEAIVAIAPATCTLKGMAAHDRTQDRHFLARRANVRN